MANATERVPINQESVEIVPIPVAASVSLKRGWMISRNAAGNAVKASDTASEHCIGIAQDDADNSDGSAGDIYIAVMRGAFQVASTETETIASYGLMRTVSDNQTVAAPGTTTNDIVAGRCIGFVSTNVVIIDFTDKGSIDATDTD